MTEWFRPVCRRTSARLLNLPDKWFLISDLRGLRGRPWFSAQCWNPTCFVADEMFSRPTPPRFRPGLRLFLLFAVGLPGSRLFGGDPQATAPAVTAVPPETCRRCHPDYYDTWSRTIHARKRLFVTTQGCEGCHGPGLQHAQSGNRGLIRRFTGMPPEVVESACLRCHENSQRLLWKGSSHRASRLTCMTCHEVHPKAQPTAAAARLTGPLGSDRLLAQNNGHTDSQLRNMASYLGVYDSTAEASPFQGAGVSPYQAPMVSVSMHYSFISR